MAMDELTERIRTSIEDPSGELWLPELTADLAARAWESLYRDIGLTPDSYGTERVLSRSISAPREITTTLKTSPSTGATPSAIAIEVLSPESAIKYQNQGVSFYSSDEILNSTILSCLEDALVVINQVPSLMKSVAALVRSLHVIRPEDDDYDVSFSEPHIPFSIFVSIPEKRITNDALRVAEAIVHEAMHLQLTLIGENIPLVQPTGKKYFSPWRETHRPLDGVLHALYVFGVIDRFLAHLSPLLNSEYLQGRRDEIMRQFWKMRSFRELQELTPIGSRFAKNVSVRL